jgi:hypothetical protein
MRMPDSSDSVMPIESTEHEGIDHKCIACEMKQEGDEVLNISRKPLNVSDLEANDQVTNEINDLRSCHGSSLDVSTKEFMESRFGYDFSKVRIHADLRAARSSSAINSLAYTLGNHIVFGEGQYQPHTIEGRRLLAHELTHFQQQFGSNLNESSSVIQRQPVESPGDILKREFEKFKPPKISLPPQGPYPGMWFPSETDPGYEEQASEPTFSVLIVAHASPRWRSSQDTKDADRRNFELSQQRANEVHIKVEEINI